MLVPWKSGPFLGKMHWSILCEVASAVKQGQLGNLSMQIYRTLFCYCKFSVCLKLLDSKSLSKTPCQSHTRKAEKMSHFLIEAKPCYPDPLHTKS